MQGPKIVQRSETRLSQWVSIVARSVLFPGRTDPDVYHALRQADYVNVLAVTRDGRVPLVRQYRPTLERYTLELPGGLRDGEESPEVAVTRELWEETGLRPFGDVLALGDLAPDAGRLENRFWCFFARVEDAPASEWRPEPGVEPLFVTKEALRNLIIEGRIENALHISLVGLAVCSGVFDWKSEA